MDKPSTAHLTEEQYKVTQEKSTETPFSGIYYDHHDDGIYRCVVCHAPLFSSKDKFDSGTGWPSFFETYAPDSVNLIDDSSHGMFRTEVVCAKCGAHAGHVFNDGPQDKTGLRYCINSCSLDFKEENE